MIRERSIEMSLELLSHALRSPAVTVTKVSDRVELVPLDCLAERVRMRRGSAGLEQRDVARITGVSKSAVCRVEQGKGCCVDTYIKLVKWLAT